MTTIELQQWREASWRDTLTRSMTWRYRRNWNGCQKDLSKRRTPRPCVIHSQEEMIAEVRKSVEDAREGRVTSSEDLDKEIETWF